MNTRSDKTNPGGELTAAFAAVTVVLLATGVAATGWGGIPPGEAVIGPVAVLGAMWLLAAVLQSTAAAALLVVAAAAAGWLDPSRAVWGIVGCNLGAAASATATGLGHFRRDAVFRRALAGSTADVVMAFLAGAVVLAVEVTIGWPSTLVAGFDAATPRALANGTLREIASPYLGFLREGLALSENGAGLVLIVVGATVTLIALNEMRRALHVISGSRRERLLRRVLVRSTGVRTGLAVGACTQSAAMTLASLVPLSASGVLDLHKSVFISRASAVGALVLPAAAALLLGVPGVGAAHAVLNVLALVLCAAPPVRAAAAATARRVARISAAQPLVGLAMMASVVLVIPVVLLGVA